jgi:hypothetical protein
MQALYISPPREFFSYFLPIFPSMLPHSVGQVLILFKIAINFIRRAVDYELRNSS